MLKSVVVGMTALTIAGSSLALAQQRPEQGMHEHGVERGAREQGAREHSARDRDHGQRRWHSRAQFNAEDLRAFEDARLAGLKAGLGLNADQEKNWPAFEAATRAFATMRIERMSSIVERRRAEPRAQSPVDRMSERANALRDRSAALSKVADATAPLYGSLDEAQKRRFNILVQASHLRPFAAPQFRWQGHGPDRSDRAFRRTEDDGMTLRAPRRALPTSRDNEDNL